MSWVGIKPEKTDKTAVHVTNTKINISKNELAHYIFEMGLGVVGYLKIQTLMEKRSPQNG